MPLKLYNTATRRKDEFVPIEAGKVRLYTCGPTVYNYAHIGNLRTYVFEDVLKRVLRLAGYDVSHVMNVTDVGHLTDDADTGEDKMELGAAREGKTVWEIAEMYWQAFRKDLAALNVIEPDIWCKATDHIDEQIKMVEVLEANGLTYTIDDGVYFDTSRLDDYGKLAPGNLAGIQAGARIEMAEGKKHPTDFALWKFSPKAQQRLMEWDSPWGVGFPGWHIECCAMAVKYLGEQLDIHCGGIDHVAIHHTNEIAQAEGALGHDWCHWWMHAEFLVMPKGPEGGGKMSKSSGEFLTLDRLVGEGYDPVAYRLFLLGAHYRQQLAFRWDAMDAATSALASLKRVVLDLRAAAGDDPGEPISKHLDAFTSAVLDDLNMPQAVAAMWAVTKRTADPAAAYATLLKMDKILGLGFADMQEAALEISEADIEQFIADRNAARTEKNFARSDEIRDELAAKGIELMDGPEGTTWRRA